MLRKRISSAFRHLLKLPLMLSSHFPQLVSPDAPKQGGLDHKNTSFARAGRINSICSHETPSIGRPFRRSTIFLLGHVLSKTRQADHEGREGCFLFEKSKGPNEFSHLAVKHS